MKKILLTLTILIMTMALSALDLNGEAQSLKEVNPYVYTAIKTRAANEWGNDHEMVVYEINQQSKALFEADGILKIDQDISAEALVTWSDELFEDGKPLYEMSIDWVMVVYEIKKQLESKGAY
jgi:hypothetical protein